MATANIQLADNINSWLVSEDVELTAPQRTSLLAAVPRMLEALGATEEAYNPTTRVRIIQSGRVGSIRGEGSVYNPSTNSQKFSITFIGDDGGIERIEDLSLIERE